MTPKAHSSSTIRLTPLRDGGLLENDESWSPGEKTIEQRTLELLDHGAADVSCWAMERITLTEAAAICGLSAHALRDAAFRGRLKTQRVGRLYVTPQAWLQQYLDTRHSGNFTKGHARGRSLRYK